MSGVSILHGNCLDVLKTMGDNSIDSVVTDPPYGLAFMGKRWDYDVPSEEIWAECLRVLKPGGHLLAFAGTRTQHRMAVRIEDAGFEIRDMIAWVYGSGFPKSHNLKDQWQGWGTALKPALEPITVARKPLIGTVAENVLAHGTGALNIDWCRIEGVKGVPASLSNAGGLGWGTGGDMERKQQQNGRWPANLIHDGSDEVVVRFPDGAPAKAGRTAKRGGSNWHGRDGLGTPEAIGTWPADPGGSAARFFYCAKASKKDRDEGCEGLVAKRGGALNMRTDSHSQNNGMDTGPRTNHHPTVKPTDLMRYLCRLVTPPNGTVLDPFMGSGSTGKAAMLEGFNFIGIEREAEYIEIAKARIEAVRDK